MILPASNFIGRGQGHFIILPFWESLETIESLLWPADKHACLQNCRLHKLLNTNNTSF